MQTIFRIIHQVDYDRHVFLTEKNGKIIGLNYHQGDLGEISESYHDADPLLTSIYESLTTFSTEERINKAIELHQKATIFQEMRTITIAYEQTFIVRKALAYYRECIERFTDERNWIADSQDEDLLDLKQLEALFEYTVSVEMTDYELNDFATKHGVKLPDYN